jgi:hypothetical protein
MVLVLVLGHVDARFDVVLSVRCSLLLLGFTFVIKESHTPFSKTYSHQNKNALQQTFLPPFHIHANILPFSTIRCSHVVSCMNSTHCCPSLVSPGCLYILEISNQKSFPPPSYHIEILHLPHLPLHSLTKLP